MFTDRLSNLPALHVSWTKTCNRHVWREVSRREVFAKPALDLGKNLQLAQIPATPNLPPDATDQQIKEQSGGVIFLSDTESEMPIGDLDDQAPASCACPRCGERDMDKLVWLDDETLRCDCGAEYRP